METTIGGRIKMIRKEANLTQQKFADRIGAKQNTVAQYEMNRNAPMDPVIRAICKEFNISEAWLRTGEGDMYKALDRYEETALLVGKVIEDDCEFRRALIDMLYKCTKDDLEVLERKFREVVENLENK